MQMIFKAINEVPVTPSGGKELYYTLWRRLLDAGMVALESISPGKDIYYGTLRCRMLSSKENYTQGSDQLHGFCDRFFSCPYSATLSFPPRGVTGTSGYCFEYDLHLINIPSHLDCESIYTPCCIYVDTYSSTSESLAISSSSTERFFCDFLPSFSFTLSFWMGKKRMLNS